MFDTSILPIDIRSIPDDHVLAIAGPVLEVPLHPEDHRQGEGREAEAVSAPRPPGTLYVSRVGLGSGLFIYF